MEPTLLSPTRPSHALCSCLLLVTIFVADAALPALYTKGGVLRTTTALRHQAALHDHLQLAKQQQRRIQFNALENVKVPNTKVSLQQQIKLYMDKLELHSSGQWFTVTWKGVKNPSYDDWLGLYPAAIVASGRYNESSPLKFKFAYTEQSHMSNGQGTHRFKVLNYRQDLAFAFLRGGFQDPLVVAVSPVIRVTNPNEPLQGHLALTGIQGEMLVQWVTANSSQPEVQWGSEPGRYSASAPARSFTFTRDQMCGAPASTFGWLDPGTQHVAVMAGLRPGSRYYYRFGDKAWGWSREFSFQAPPLPGPSGGRVHLLATADVGQAEEDGSMEEQEVMRPSLNTTRLMGAEAQHYSLLLHTGDISYARGYASQWDNFFSQLQPLAASMPYMMAPGNHERDFPGSGDRYGVFDSGGECGVPYELRAVMPSQGRDKQWYSFDYGPVHFLLYSTEHDFVPGSEQYDFIAKDLSRVDRRLTPWVVLGGHRPMYVSSVNSLPPDGDQVVAAELRAALEGLLVQYKVDLTLHGHHHTYQRTCPVIRGQCQGLDAEGVARAPVHLIIGHGGAGLSLNFQDPPPEFLEASYLWWGYARVSANMTSLEVEVVSDLDGAVVDRLALSKPADWGGEGHAEGLSPRPLSPRS